MTLCYGALTTVAPCDPVLWRPDDCGALCYGQPAAPRPTCRLLRPSAGPARSRPGLTRLRWETTTASLLAVLLPHARLDDDAEDGVAARAAVVHVGDAEVSKILAAAHHAQQHLGRVDALLAQIGDVHLSAAAGVTTRQRTVEAEGLPPGSGPQRRGYHPAVAGVCHQLIPICQQPGLSMQVDKLMTAGSGDLVS